MRFWLATVRLRSSRVRAHAVWLDALRVWLGVLPWSGVGFTVAAKADLSSGFADDGCGFLDLPHGEAILVGELFVHRRETDVPALDWAAHAMEAHP